MKAVLGTLLAAPVAAVLLVCAALAAVALGVPVVVAWCAGLLVLIPVSRADLPRGFGARSTAWLALVPFIALFARLSCGWELTAARSWRCGTGELGWLLVPPIVAVFVVAVGVPTSLLVRRARPSAPALRGLALALALPLTLALACGAHGATSPVPTAAEQLSSAVVLARWPADATPARTEVGGHLVARLCEGECVVTIDDERVEMLDASQPLEVVTAAGHAFVRPAASEVRAWVLVDRDAPLRIEDLGADAPRGFGTLALASALLAALHLAGVYRALRRVAQLARSVRGDVVAEGVLRLGDVVVACDRALALGPALALAGPRDVGSYRAPKGPALAAISGERAPLLDDALLLAREHLFASITALALGATPAVVARAVGLSPAL